MSAVPACALTLGLALCGCAGHPDDTGLFERNVPAMAREQAQPVSTPAPAPSAPSGSPAAAQTASALIGQVAPDASGPPLVVAPQSEPDAGPPPPPASPEPPRPKPAPPPASNACFEYLGDWITCENAGWPNVEQTSAQDLQSCMDLCQQRPDCTAVTEYFWMDRADLGCSLYLSTCDEPAGGPWQEEDGGRQYRKRCATP